jgi:hypothetical protein
MKRIEVRLSVEVVEPLLGVIEAAAESLVDKLAVSPTLTGLEPDLCDAWMAELQAAQAKEVRELTGIFDANFRKTGLVAFDESNAEPIIRACTAMRLRIREAFLDRHSDETLESGDVELDDLAPGDRRAFRTW